MGLHICCRIGNRLQGTTRIDDLGAADLIQTLSLFFYVGRMIGEWRLELVQIRKIDPRFQRRPSRGIEAVRACSNRISLPPNSLPLYLDVTVTQPAKSILSQHHGGASPQSEPGMGHKATSDLPSIQWRAPHSVVARARYYTIIVISTPNQMQRGFSLEMVNPGPHNSVQ